MPTNESIIAVPITVEQKGQVRQFLVRLVEKLDIVLGYRGNDPYVTISQLQSASSEGLTQLEQTILNVITIPIFISAFINSIYFVNFVETCRSVYLQNSVIMP